MSTYLQSQKSVTANLKSKQLLPFDFAPACTDRTILVDLDHIMRTEGLQVNIFSVTIFGHTTEAMFSFSALQFTGPREFNIYWHAT